MIRGIKWNISLTLIKTKQSKTRSPLPRKNNKTLCWMKHFHNVGNKNDLIMIKF